MEIKKAMTFRYIRRFIAQDIKFKSTYLPGCRAGDLALLF